MTYLVVEQDGPLKRIILNRPEKRNALSLLLAEEITEQIQIAEVDGTRLIALQGNGSSFCAGFDFGNFPDCSSADLLLQFVRIEQMLQAVAYASIDTVAFIHGSTIGAGADLAIACRHRAASSNTKMMFPGSRFGLVLGTRRLAECVGGERAQRMVGGAQINTQEALEIGIANTILEASEQADYENTLLEFILQVPADTRSQILKATRVDTRAEDMTDLVKSASAADLKERLAKYLTNKK
jgi:enoyl-CoA hydratase/carnithine racemase